MRRLCWITLLLCGLTLGVNGCSAPAPAPAEAPVDSVACPVSDTPTAPVEAPLLLAVAAPETTSRSCLVVATRVQPSRGLLVSSGR